MSLQSAKVGNFLCVAQLVEGRRENEKVEKQSTFVRYCSYCSKIVNQVVSKVSSGNNYSRLTC